MRTWEGLFKDYIVERGLEYYISGDVICLDKIDDDTYEAVVRGREDYAVTIEFINGELKNMNCTCPYASKGYYCKHMAAALYAIEQGLDFNGDDRLVLENVIREMPKEKLEQLVFSYLKRDEKFKRYIMNQCHMMSKKAFILVKFSLRDLVFKHYDDNKQCILQKDLALYIFDLHNYLDENVPNLIGKQNMYAFHLCNAVFEEINEQQFQFIDQQIDEIKIALTDYWKQIFNVSTIDEKKKMLTYFDENLFLISNSNINQAIIEFYKQVELDFDLVKERFKHVHEILHRNILEVYLIQYVKLSMELLTQLGKSLDEILDYIAPYEVYESVIKDKIQLILAFKEYEYAASYIRKMLLVCKNDKEFVQELEALLETIKI